MQLVRGSWCTGLGALRALVVCGLLLGWRAPGSGAAEPVPAEPSEGAAEGGGAAGALLPGADTSPLGAGSRDQPATDPAVPPATEGAGSASEPGEAAGSGSTGAEPQAAPAGGKDRTAASGAVSPVEPDALDVGELASPALIEADAVEAAGKGQTNLLPKKRAFRISMSLEDAIRMGIENGLGIKVSRLDSQQRQRDIVVEQAVFDPFFNLGTAYAKNRDPTISVFEGSTQGVAVSPSETFEYHGSLTGTYLLGTQYELRLSQNQLDKPNINTTFTLLNPVARTAVTASLRQPILKGAWYSINTANVRIAENNARVAREDLELRIIDTVYEIETAYWGLVFSRQNVSAKKKALSIGILNLDNVKRKKDIGTQAAVDVTAAGTQVALRRVELEQAELLAEQARDRLLNAMNYTRNESLKGIWEGGSRVAPFDNIELECTTKPQQDIPIPRRNDSLSSAFSSRPEYRRLELLLRNQEIRVDVAKNAMLPSLDVVGSWSQLGLEDSLGGSYDEFGTGQYYDWGVGAEFSIPLANRSARNQYQNARDEFRKFKISKQDLENQIVLEVDQAIRRISSLRRQVAELEERVLLQAELLKAERIKLDVGKSIPYLVSVIANDLVDSLTESLRVQADLQIAHADLLRATGKLLSEHQILLTGE